MACILCGYHTTQGSMFSLDSIHDFVKKYVEPTPFHYQHVLKLPASSSPYRNCVHCINWKRRVIQYSYQYHVTQNKRTMVPAYTPLDHMIMYTMEPGVTQEPDHRCIKRLLAICLHPQNPFRHIIPYPSMKIMEKCGDYSGEELPEKIVLFWHAFNEKTPFFRSRMTAKMVRRANRQNNLYATIPPMKRIRWRH